MINKDTDNKIPIYKLTSKDKVLEYYDEWSSNAQFNQDTGGFPRGAPGCTRVPVSTRTIVPRCAGQTRGPCSPKRARSKMGYPANRMLLRRGFREGRAPFAGIARPPGHRWTPDRFHPPWKSSLRIVNFFGHPHFPKFLKLYEKLKFCPFRTSRDDFDRKQAPQTPESTSSRSARPFPTFPCFAQKVSIFEA